MVLGDQEQSTEISVKGQIILGNEHWANGNLKEAFKVFSETLLAHPDDPAINRQITLFMLSKLALDSQQQGKLEETIAISQAMLALLPGNTDVQKTLALALFTQGYAKQAEELLVPLLYDQSDDMADRVLADLVAIVERSQHNPQALSQRFFHLESLARKVPKVGEIVEALTQPQLTRYPSLCVVGMHRSGTSMVTRLLGDLGLNLGPAAMLVPAKDDNPEGFFENSAMSELNTDLLSYFGGSWDSPPEPELRFSGNETLLPFKRRAKLLAAGLAAGVSTALGWGWKDPRTPITLPFWLDILPNMQLVVVFRDPGDVALSLMKRGGYHTPEFGFVLRKKYYDKLFQVLGERKFLGVQYEAFFDRPETELVRLCKFLGWETSSEKMALAVSHFRLDLRHNSGQLDWRSVPAGKALLPMYERLLGLSAETGLGLLG